jgi:adenylylsulfate kinase-like enzyme
MKNKILWFTGLSGAGKTTLANIISKKLKKKSSKLKKLMVIYLEKKIK